MEGVRLFVGGGQDYHGPTAGRDARIVSLVASQLVEAMGPDGVEIITGGMPGIPNDFALAYAAAGGKRVLCIVSSEQEEAFRERNKDNDFSYQVIGESQEKRRIAVTKLEGIKAALFIQGGKYSTHEMKLFEERGIPIIALWSSGGAAGGGQEYEGYTYKNKPEDPLLWDPEEKHAGHIADRLVKECLNAIGRADGV